MRIQQQSIKVLPVTIAHVYMRILYLEPQRCKIFEA